jgi:hypothetical protein
VTILIRSTLASASPERASQRETDEDPEREAAGEGRRRDHHGYRALDPAPSPMPSLKGAPVLW